MLHLIQVTLFRVSTVLLISLYLVMASPALVTPSITPEILSLATLVSENDLRKKNVPGSNYPGDITKTSVCFL